jgi:hypothetical protein
MPPHEPLDNGGGLLRVLPQPRAEVLLNGLSNAGAHCGISEHATRGAFEFRILQLHRHDRCQALANQLGAEYRGPSPSAAAAPARMP